MYTASAKIIDHDRFRDGMAKVAVLSGLAPFLSRAVPAAEIIVAALLIMPRFIKTGLYAFTGLMLLFSGYIAGMLLWAKHLPCRCGGAIEKLSWPQHLWFNGAFIVLAIVAVRLSNSKKTKHEKF